MNEGGSGLLAVTKRPNNLSSDLMPLLKKPRAENALVRATSDKAKQLARAAPTRTSSLQAPIICLEGGHSDELYAGKFHPKGTAFVATGGDRSISFWAVYGNMENYHTIPTAMNGAIVDLQFDKKGDNFIVASTDNFAGYFDMHRQCRVRKLVGHQQICNGASFARNDNNMACSVGDDSAVMLWDVRQKKFTQKHQFKFQQTACCFADTDNSIYIGGIDNDIKVYDRRTNTIAYRLVGHGDTITSVSLSPDGTTLASNSMDSTIRLWDVRPFCKAPTRMLRILQGHEHSFEKNLIKVSWTPDGRRIGSGSADQYVYCWEAKSGRILYKLPGHKGSVNDVNFHPVEPIIGSVSNDGMIFIGEIM